MEKDNNKGGMMSVIAALGANVLVAISNSLVCSIRFSRNAQRINP